jgi:hypothetical protein
VQPCQRAAFRHRVQACSRPSEHDAPLPFAVGLNAFGCTDGADDCSPYGVRHGTQMLHVAFHVWSAAPITGRSHSLPSDWWQY